MAALSGETPTDADSVRLDGRPIGGLSAGARRDQGLGFVPEERLGRGAVPAMSLARNALLTAWRRGMVRHGLVAYAGATTFAAGIIERFGVKCSGTEALARSLSGGNLQKFIVGREIVQAPKVLLVSQPTWGVDVGASAQLRQTLVDLSRAGVAILVVSEELEELFEICDRIAVLAAGRLSPPQPRSATNAEAIGLLMAGQHMSAAA